MSYTNPHIHTDSYYETEGHHSSSHSSDSQAHSSNAVLDASDTNKCNQNTVQHRRSHAREKYVQRLREEDYSLFLDLVKLHLSFLFELCMDQFNHLFGENANETVSERIKLKRSTPKCKGEGNANIRKRLSLGSSLDRLDQTDLEHTKTRPETISAAVGRLCAHLQSVQHLCQEGIFRKSGNFNRQKELKAKLLDQVDKVDLSTGVYTTHDCASVLKLLLGDLEEPLLHSRYLLAHLYTLDMTNHEKRLKVVCLLLQMLSADHFPLAKTVFTLLHKATQHASDNLMPAHNLASLFSPHMLHPKDRTVDSANIEKMTAVVSFIITHTPVLFEAPRLLALDASAKLGRVADDSTLSMGSQKHKLSDEDEPIATIVAFTSRSSVADTHTTTLEAVARLKEDVRNMPDSECKRKYMKMLEEDGKEGNHKRTKSLSETIKRKLSKRYRKKSSNKVTLGASPSVDIEQQPTANPARPLLHSSTANTPLKSLTESPYPLHKAVIKRLLKTNAQSCTTGAANDSSVFSLESIPHGSPATPSQDDSHSMATSTPLMSKPLLPNKFNLPNGGSWQTNIKKTKPEKVFIIHHRRLRDASEEHQATPPRVPVKIALAADSGFSC